jgi:hypothetical protein
MLEENEKNNHGWSQREIAEFCKVSHHLVQTIVKSTSQVESGINSKKDSEGGLLEDDAGAEISGSLADALEQDDIGETSYPAISALPDDGEDEDENEGEHKEIPL